MCPDPETGISRLYRYMDCKSAILLCLDVHGDPMTVHQLCQATGKSRVKVHEALARLLALGAVTKTIQGYVCSVPKTVQCTRIGTEVGVPESVQVAPAGVPKTVQGAEGGVPKTVHPGGSDVPESVHLELEGCTENGTVPDSVQGKNPDGDGETAECTESGTEGEKDTLFKSFLLSQELNLEEKDLKENVGASKNKAKIGPTRAEAQILLETYNRHRGPLPEARMLDSRRESHLKAIVRAFGLEQAVQLLADATQEVSRDEFWVRNKYNLDNLFRHYLGKAEKWRARATAPPPTRLETREAARREEDWLPKDYRYGEMK